MSLDCSSILAVRSWLWLGRFWLSPHADQNGIEVCSIGLPSGRVMACT